MATLLGIIEEGPNTSMSRMAFFLSTITNELSEELTDMDEGTIRVFLFQIGEVIAWIGHGDNERLPDAIRPFADQIQPSKKKDFATDDTEASSTPPELDSASR